MLGRVTPCLPVMAPCRTVPNPQTPGSPRSFAPLGGMCCQLTYIGQALASPGRRLTLSCQALMLVSQAYYSVARHSVYLLSEVQARPITASCQSRSKPDCAGPGWAACSLLDHARPVCPAVEHPCQGRSSKMSVANCQPPRLQNPC